MDVTKARTCCLAPGELAALRGTPKSLPWPLGNVVSALKAAGRRFEGPGSVCAGARYHFLPPPPRRGGRWPPLSPLGSGVWEAEVLLLSESRVLGSAAPRATRKRSSDPDCRLQLIVFSLRCGGCGFSPQAEAPPRAILW